MNSKLTKFIDIFTKNSRIGFLTIIALTFVSYSNIFQNQFVMDDFDYVVNWPLIRDWSNLPQFFVDYTPLERQEGVYSPLKTLIHAIEYRAFGLKPFGYHVVGLLTHILAVFFVYRIIRALTKQEFVTFMGTLLFALHPVHIEYVSYITGSVDVVGIVFLFMSFYFYIKAQEKEKLNVTFYSVSLILAVLAIYTHELALSLPFLFLWYDFCFMKEKQGLRGMFVRAVPFFAMGALYVLSKHLVLGSVTRGSYIYDSGYLTLLVIIKAWAKYVLICFFPVVLTHNHIISKGIYSFDPEDFDQFSVLSQSLLDPQILMSLILLGAVFYAAYKSYRKQTLVTFAIGWFFICLLPVSNIVPSGVYFAERYLYPGTLGFCLLLGLGFHQLYEYKGKNVRLSGVVIVVLLLLSTYYTVRTWVRNKDWRNEIALYESAVKANPDSALMRTDLGIVYSRLGRPKEAIKRFEEALSIRGNDPVTYFSMADAYMQLEHYNQAIEALQRAIDLSPEYADAYFNLAGIYAFWEMKDQAKNNLDKALHYYREQGRDKDADLLERAFQERFGSLQ